MIIRQVVVVVDKLAFVGIGLHGLAQRIGRFDTVVLERGDQSGIIGDELLTFLVFGKPVQEESMKKYLEPPPTSFSLEPSSVFCGTGMRPMFSV